MNFSPKLRIFLIASLAIAAAAGLVGNLLSSEIQQSIKTQFQTYFGERSNYTLALLLIFVGLIWVSYWLAKRLNPSPETAPENYRSKLIKTLQNRYKERFVKKMVSDQKFEIQLDLTYTKQGTTQDFFETYYLEQYEEKPVGNFSQLFNTYLKQLKRLLIIGEPGAGKTVLLLKFAQQLLVIAEQSKEFPIAMIVNLSSWRNEGQKFTTWLEQNLVYAIGKYGALKQETKQLTYSNQLLLLLDGLDEMPAIHRDSCLEQLSNYLQEVNAKRSLDQNFPEVIICCRQKEYKQMQGNAPVQATVLIQPLTLSSVSKALNNIQSDQIRGLPADRLQKAIHKKKPVTELLTTAFFVNIALTLAKKERDYEELNQPDAFLKLYIQEEIAALGEFDNPEKIHHWLSYLSKQLDHTNKGIIFELADIQSEWLQYSRSLRWVNALIFGMFSGLVYSLFSGLVYGLAGGLFSGLVYGIAGGLFVGLVYGLSGGLIYGLVVGLVIGLEMYNLDRINPVEIMKFKKLKIKNILSRLVDMLVGMLVGGLVVGLVYSLVVGLVGGLVYGLVGGLIYGLVVGLVVSLLLETFDVKRFPKTEKPYQRFISPIAREYTPLCIIIACEILYPYRTLNWVLLTLVLVLLFGLYSLVFTSIGKHFLLRLLLSIEGVIPFQLVRFLDLVSDKTGLIEKDGGQWRFRHQLIKDVLAGKNINPSPVASTHDHN